MIVIIMKVYILDTVFNEMLRNQSCELRRPIAFKSHPVIAYDSRIAYSRNKCILLSFLIYLFRRHCVSPWLLLLLQKSVGTGHTPHTVSLVYFTFHKNRLGVWPPKSPLLNF
jgi:hypothetical protein